MGATVNRQSRQWDVSKSAASFTTWLWREGGWIGNLLRLPFTLLSWIYGRVSWLRVCFYERGVFSTKRLGCYVVSVGNITSGGTGKTPMTIYLAEQWRKRGKTVGIVSRGYRRKNKDAVVLVSDGSQTLETPRSVGDEPYLMAERLRGVPIVVANDRYEGCHLLTSKFQIDLILLDDGFQHLQLHRDQNLLLIDASNPFGNGTLLPRGTLREPLSAIGRADCVILTRTEEGKETDNLLDSIAAMGRPILRSRFQATALIDMTTGARHPISDLSDQAVFVFCGIGNPDAFLKQLTALGASVKDVLIFRDHHFYEDADIAVIKNRSASLGVKKIVTTEKDAVKLKDLSMAGLEIQALRVEVDFMGRSQDHVTRLFKEAPNKS